MRCTSPPRLATAVPHGSSNCTPGAAAQPPNHHPPLYSNHAVPDALDAREAQRVARGKLAGADGAQVGAHLQSIGWMAAQGERSQLDRQHMRELSTGPANHATVQQHRWHSLLQQCALLARPGPARPGPAPKSPAARCSWWGLKSTPRASPAQSACMHGACQQDACLQRDKYVAHAS